MVNIFILNVLSYTTDILYANLHSESWSNNFLLITVIKYPLCLWRRSRFAANLQFWDTNPPSIYDYGMSPHGATCRLKLPGMTSPEDKKFGTSQLLVCTLIWMVDRLGQISFNWGPNLVQIVLFSYPELHIPVHFIINNRTITLLFLLLLLFCLINIFPHFQRLC